MAQESYADFSIIQKYIDQKKIFDQEIADYKEQINELKSQLLRYQAEIQKKNQLINQLRDKLDGLLVQIQEKDKKINMLEQQVKQLNQQISQFQSTETNIRAPSGEDSKRGVFSFGKK
ncbi:MAG: hypothetical protein JRG73_00390 [Deltaproteobacteria bacterium]|nr:hypothetical protein [Deltaproteobacteria bacterium]MBW2305362.1 hypothetical protein [Deltaproteobacteria bacterium]